MVSRHTVTFCDHRQRDKDVIFSVVKEQDSSCSHVISSLPFICLKQGHSISCSSVQYWSHVPKKYIEEKYTNNFCLCVQKQQREGKWILQSFLQKAKRKRVILNGKCSSLTYVKADAPEGLIL